MQASRASGNTDLCIDRLHRRLQWRQQSQLTAYIFWGAVARPLLTKGVVFVIYDVYACIFMGLSL